MAGAVLNAEGGPILIRENSVIEPLAYVEGPAVIGEGSRVKAGAQVRFTLVPQPGLLVRALLLGSGLGF